jgi:hypothetical protein
MNNSKRIEWRTEYTFHPAGTFSLYLEGEEVETVRVIPLVNDRTEHIPYYERPVLGWRWTARCRADLKIEAGSGSPVDLATVEAAREEAEAFIKGRLALV